VKLTLAFSPAVAGLETQWCPEIVELMQRMWAQDAADRPDMKDVVIEVERLVKKYK
jgi:mitogen-activated protein kinase kinase kinase 13